jgi:hypothetical protein
MSSRLRGRLWPAAALAIAGTLAGSCAKFPSTGGGADDTRLIFTLTVADPINGSFVYMVALRPSTETSPTTPGPIPVIAPPWGNGFVAGNCTNFIRWDNHQSPEFLIYAFRDAQLLDYFPIGTPVVFEPFTPGTRTLRFEIDLTQIVSAATAEDYKSIQVNFLTMDVVPQGSATNKTWDALGDSRLPSGINQYVTIPLTTSGTYDNARFQDLEPPNDVADPALDLVDWEIEVRR